VVYEYAEEFRLAGNGQAPVNILSVYTHRTFGNSNRFADRRIAVAAQGEPRDVALLSVSRSAGSGMGFSFLFPYPSWDIDSRPAVNNNPRNEKRGERRWLADFPERRH